MQLTTELLRREFLAIQFPHEVVKLHYHRIFWNVEDYAIPRAVVLVAHARSNIDYSRPFDWEDDLVGLEGWIILGVKKSDEYGDQNTVKKYVAPK
jgi:hypothetical protein